MRQSCFLSVATLRVTRAVTWLTVYRSLYIRFRHEYDFEGRRAFPELSRHGSIFSQLLISYMINSYQYKVDDHIEVSFSESLNKN